MAIHPISILDEVLDDYRSYLRSEFRAKDPDLKAALDRELDADWSIGSAKLRTGRDDYGYSSLSLADWRSRELLQFQVRYTDWRGWTLRGWRLSRYLQHHAAAAKLVDLGRRER